MNGYFYVFADIAAAQAAGAMAGEEPAHPDAIILREAGIELTDPVVDPETQDIITAATMSAPLVILSPAILPGCSDAVIVPAGHSGFA